MGWLSQLRRAELMGSMFDVLRRQCVDLHHDPPMRRCERTLRPSLPRASFPINLCGMIYSASPFGWAVYIH